MGCIAGAVIIANGGPSGGSGGRCGIKDFADLGWNCDDEHFVPAYNNAIKMGFTPQQILDAFIYGETWADKKHENCVKWRAHARCYSTPQGLIIPYDYYSKEVLTVIATDNGPSPNNKRYSKGKEIIDYACFW